MSYKKKLSSMASQVGEEGVNQLAYFLDQEAEKADEPWKKTLLDLLADAGRKHGPEGFKRAQDAVERLLDRNEPQDIRKMTNNLLVASNLLAQLQNAEAQRKEQVRKFLRALVQTIGTILKAVLGVVL
jgi:hypothetical protein